ncbi:MAG: lysophospholipid acyltransferase family protein [Candidatus Omnitrophota bacterium]|nr:MAG: lysophospholipid acyltransferase family protein [Candidatus Omnitrophota bacterium]
MKKEQRKMFRRRIGYYALRIFTFLNSKVPLGWSYFMGASLGTIAYGTLFRHRHIALECLSVAFPKLSVRERKRIARHFFIFLAQGSFECLYFLRKPKMLDNIRIEGKEHLDKALQNKRGVMMITGHLGNFPLLSMKLVQEGYPVHFVTRPMRDPKAGDYLHTLRTAAGVKTIFSYPRKECVNGIIQAMRNNEIVIIQMDQNFGTGGVWVNFFGKLAATPVGPIVFALRTNASIVPAYIVRESMGKHCVKILPQEELIKKEDKDETVLLNTIKISRIIERWVREFPSQWGWIHRRWKSRPSEKVKNLKFKIEKKA